jgi:hypothetical protein
MLLERHGCEYHCDHKTLSLLMPISTYVSLTQKWVLFLHVNQVPANKSELVNGIRKTTFDPKGPLQAPCQPLIYVPILRNQYPAGSGSAGNAEESMLLRQLCFQCEGVYLSTMALNASCSFKKCQKLVTETSDR